MQIIKSFHIIFKFKKILEHSAFKEGLNNFTSSFSSLSSN